MQTRRIQWSRFYSLSFVLLLRMGVLLGAIFTALAFWTMHLVEDQAKKDARLFYLEAESFFSDFLSRIERGIAVEATLLSLGLSDQSCTLSENIDFLTSAEERGALYLGGDGSVVCQTGIAPSASFVRTSLENWEASTGQKAILTALGNRVYLLFPMEIREQTEAFALSVGTLPNAQGILGVHGRLLLLGQQGLLYDSFGTSSDIPKNVESRDISQLFGETHDLAFLGVNGTGATLIAIGPERGGVASIAAIWVFTTFLFLLALLGCYWPVDRLVGGYVRDLSFRIKRFSQDGQFTQGRARPNVQELILVERAFENLLDEIRDKRVAVNRQLKERRLLLKEVHHRVNNNLQTISSLISMTLRKASSDAEKVALMRIQDRVLTLATIHRVLLNGDGNGIANFDHLLREVLGQYPDRFATQEGASFAIEIEPIILAPDQAVPFALFAVEAIAQAASTAKDIGVAYGARVFLFEENGDGVHLIVEHTAIGFEHEDHVIEPFLRGLLQAYAAQLGANLELRRSRHSYSRGKIVSKTAHEGSFAQIHLTFSRRQAATEQRDF